jgi:predicted RNase H-like nuclease (RuvC/YqgF family)
MNANELADELEMVMDGYAIAITASGMLRQQQAEIEALKMGFANSGTHDSELAETRAMAGRLFLKVQDLEFEQEGYENLTEMLESEKAELTEKNCQQQAEIEELRKFKAEIDAENKKLFEAAQKANAIWDRATGVKNEQ